MKHVVATRYRGIPAVVFRQIGFADGQAVAGASAGGDRPHLRFPRHAAHRGADCIAALQEFDDAPTGHEAGASRDQDRITHIASDVYSCIPP